MAFVTEGSLRQLVRSQTIFKAAGTILKEEASASKRDSYDVFLSHSFKDAELVLGVKRMLEAKNLTVYVDWIEDPQMDRERVSAATAQVLRSRMNQSKSFMYAYSTNSLVSKWMPWEVGYYDGRRGVVVILPIVKNADETFKGQEFLGLYPYIDGSVDGPLWVNKGDLPASTLGSNRSYETFQGLTDWMKDRAGVTI